MSKRIPEKGNRSQCSKVLTKTVCVSMYVIGCRWPPVQSPDAAVFSDTWENTRVPPGLLVDTSRLSFTQSEKQQLNHHRYTHTQTEHTHTFILVGLPSSSCVAILLLQSALIEIRTLSIGWDFSQVYKRFQGEQENKLKWRWNVIHLTQIVDDGGFFSLWYVRPLQTHAFVFHDPSTTLF